MNLRAGGDVRRDGKRAETKQGEGVAGSRGGDDAVAMGGGFGCRRRGFLLVGGDGGQGRFDAGGVQGGQVEEGERFLGVALGEEVAELAAGGLDVGEQVIGEQVAVADQEEVGFGEAALGCARVGEVGGAAFLRAVRGVSRDFVEGAGEFAQVAVEEGRQQGVEVGEVSPEGAGGHTQGLGQAGGRHGVDAVSGHEALGDGEDAGVLLLLTDGEVGRVALEAFGVGAEDSGWGLHGGRKLFLPSKACQELIFLVCGFWASCAENERKR